MSGPSKQRRKGNAPGGAGPRTGSAATVARPGVAVATSTGSKPAATVPSAAVSGPRAASSTATVAAPKPRAEGRADFASAEHLQNKYQISLRYADKSSLPPTIGHESSMLTPGQVRGFEAQREVRALRQQQAATPAGDSLAGLKPTNDSLHRYVDAAYAAPLAPSLTPTQQAAAKRAQHGTVGAAIQGHGLVHTPQRPGEVLLGSRSSAEYKALSEQTTKDARTSTGKTPLTEERGRSRVANVTNWDINRNDAFMSGALLGHNTFTLPLDNARKDYVRNNPRGGPAGRVTIREMAQVDALAARPADSATLAPQRDRFVVGQSKALSVTPESLHKGMPAIGEPAQAKKAAQDRFATLPQRATHGPGSARDFAALPATATPRGQTPTGALAQGRAASSGPQPPQTVAPVTGATPQRTWASIAASGTTKPATGGASTGGTSKTTTKKGGTG